jgi:hypothetical protein
VPKTAPPGQMRLLEVGVSVPYPAHCWQVLARRGCAMIFGSWVETVLRRANPHTMTATITYTDGRTLSGRVRGSPKRVMTLVLKLVTAAIWSPAVCWADSMPRYSSMAGGMESLTSVTSSAIRASRSARSMASVRWATNRRSAAVFGLACRPAAGAAGVGEVVVDGGAGAFEGAVYGFLGEAEHLGDFGGVVAQDVAEDERGRWRGGSSCRAVMKAREMASVVS